MKRDEDGYLIVTILLFMMLLSVIGIAASQTSSVEIQIAGNARQADKTFYRTDGRLVDTIEHYRSWFNDDDFLAVADEAAYRKEIDEDEDGTPDFTIEARSITAANDKVGALSDFANDIPADQHTGPPPTDSFYSAQHFYTRRFAVTVRSAGDRTVLQAGVWKAFAHR